ncbi:DUF6207 family protein [Streptomyces sp. NPDC001296]
MVRRRVHRARPAGVRLVLLGEVRAGVLFAGVLRFAVLHVVPALLPVRWSCAGRTFRTRPQRRGGVRLGIRVRDPSGFPRCVIDTSVFGRPRGRHVAGPGLVVVEEVAAADDATEFAFQKALGARWATATADRTTRNADETAPGTRLTCRGRGARARP